MREGFPIQRSPDQRLLATSPELIAGCYVFLRLFHAKSSTVCPFVLQPSGCPTSRNRMVSQLLQLRCIAYKCCFYALHVSRLNRYTYLTQVVKQQSVGRPVALDDTSIRSWEEPDKNRVRSTIGTDSWQAEVKQKELGGGQAPESHGDPLRLRPLYPPWRKKGCCSSS